MLRWPGSQMPDLTSGSPRRRICPEALAPDHARHRSGFAPGGLRSRVAQIAAAGRADAKSRCARDPFQSSSELPGDRASAAWGAAPPAGQPEVRAADPRAPRPRPSRRCRCSSITDFEQDVPLGGPGLREQPPEHASAPARRRPRRAAGGMAVARCARRTGAACSMCPSRLPRRKISMPCAKILSIQPALPFSERSPGGFGVML